MNINWTTIIESIGLVGIISGLIVWLIKSLGEHFISKNLKSYEIELQSKSDNYKLELDKLLENHKSELNVLYLKASKLYDKRMLILSELYQKIVTLDRSMNEMVRFLVEVREDAEKEEQERLQNSGKAHDDFMKYYTENKIFFSTELCGKLYKLRTEYFDSYWEYTFRHRFPTDDFKTIHEKSKKASEILKKQIPPILLEIEGEFRLIIGVE